MIQIPNFKRYIATETLGSIIGAVGAVGSATINGFASGKMNRRAEKFNREEAEKQREWSEQQTAKQNAWNYQMWKEATEYDSPVNQVERLRDAGLNPLYYGLDGNASQSAPSAAQPLGYQRAQAPNYNNPIGDALQTFMSARSLQKDIELKNAQIDKMKEDTEGTRLDNEWKDKTLDARAQAEKLRNDVTKQQMDEIDTRIKQNKQATAKLLEETKNEEERRALIIADKMLKEANAKQIAYLMPYQKLLIEAQTQAQKASAAASYANAAINQGLLDAGYVEKQIDDITASIRQKNSAADSQEAQKAINEWKMSVRNGTTFNPDSYSDGVRKVLAEAMNGLFGMTSTISEAVGGGLSGFLK